MALLGQTVLGVRLASALFGVLGVFTSYLLFRRLFGPGVALLAASLLSVSLWSLMYSRVGLRHISLPPWIALSAYCFWRGLEAPAHRRGRGTSWFAAGGLCLGAMLYTYFASRVVPLIFVAFTLYLALFHRHKLRGRWMGLLFFFLLPALLVTPMVLYLRQHPELEQRLGQVGAEIFAGLRVGDPRPLAGSILNTLKMFSLQGDPEWLYNISGRPVFDPLTAIAFYGGILVSLWCWRDPKRAFILIWLAAGVAPAMLSWPPGSLGHTIAAQPVAFVFPALFCAQLWHWAGDTRWLRRGAVALTIGMVLLFATLNLRDYFYRWPRYPAVRHEYQAPITAVARYLRARYQPARYQRARYQREQHTGTDTGLPNVAISAPYVDYWNPWSKRNFDLYLGEQALGGAGANVRWFNGASSILFPAGTNQHEEALFFLPDHIRLPSELDPELHALLISGSRPVELAYTDPDGTRFDLYRWEDGQALERHLQSLSSAPVWTSPEGPYVPGESETQRRESSLPLDFGHRLSLLGYATNRTGDTPLSAGETWRVTTYWRVQDADSAPLAIFVHVLDDDNSLVTGWDGLHVSTESWQRGDVFAQVHTLVLPDHAPSGVQRVELGVYSPFTLERLPVYSGQAGETAPHGRVLLDPLNIQ
jgi:4-amino-4-deoxy-L-arabinose transferase-like glycosyltransferase